MTIPLLMVAMKVIWNFGLPYAMLKHPEKKGWSIFPLIECAPLLASMAVAWMAGLGGDYSPGRIGFVGGLAIVVSYLHLLLAPIGYGIVVHGILGEKHD